MKTWSLIALLIACTLTNLKGQNIALKGGLQVLSSVEGRAYSGGLLELEGKKSKHWSLYSRLGYNAQSENIVSGVPVQYQLFNLGTGFKFYLSEVFQGVHLKGGLYYGSEFVDFDLEEARFLGATTRASFETQRYAGLDLGLGYATLIDKIYLGFDLGLGYDFFNPQDAFVSFSTQVGYRF